MRKRSLTIILIIAIITGLSWQESRHFARSVIGKMTSPAMELLSRSGFKLKNSFSFIFNIGDLKRKNEELANKLLQVQVDQSQIIELETENQLLKKELGFLDSAEKGTLIPAKITEREPTAFLDYIIVDKGTDDGISIGMPVVYSGVLVGQVSETYQTFSKITLITSKDSLVQVMLQNSRAKGLLKGGISGLYMDNVVFDTDYAPGEYVITSGLGGKIKEGIPVGKAGKTQSSSSEIYKTIAVDSLVDLSKIELVFIIQK